jgi:hypothetical protein
MDDKLDDTLGELGGLMHRAALLRAEMTNDEYLNYVHRHGDGPQFMYEQLFGAVAILCMNGHTPDDIVPALIRACTHKIAIGDSVLTIVRFE